MPKMTNHVFFSWQSDRPDVGGKTLLETSLHAALTKLSDSTILDEAERSFVLDRDTQGVPGSPPIIDVIFNKIDNAAIFVADMTFIGTRVDGRPTPNPNVLIEYGWALKSLGYSRVIAVMNEAYGKPSAESLPFDMRHLRHPITYSCPEGAATPIRNAARDTLTRRLSEELRAVFSSEAYRATSAADAPKAPFALAKPKEGSARFRTTGEPIGIDASMHSIFTMGTQKEVKLRAGPTFWLRIAPTQEQGRYWELTAIEEAATVRNTLITPMAEYMNYGKVRGPDGWGVYASRFNGEDETRGVVFCFKTGEVWTVDTYPATAFSESGHKNQIAFPESYFIGALEEHIPFLRRLGITGPLQWEAGIEGIKGYTFQYELNRVPRHTGPFLTDIISMRGSHVEGQSPIQTLMPFFESLFSDAGVKRPAELNHQ